MLIWNRWRQLVLRLERLEQRVAHLEAYLAGKPTPVDDLASNEKFNFKTRNSMLLGSSNLERHDD